MLWSASLVSLHHFVKCFCSNFRFLFHLQIKVPHPYYPSTCISVQVPNLSVHFSPSRYRKLIELLNIFSGASEISGQPNDHSFPATLTSWDAIDLASNARILVWRVCFEIPFSSHCCFCFCCIFLLYVSRSTGVVVVRELAIRWPHGSNVFLCYLGSICMF